VAPANPASTLVAISGVVQNPSNYTVSSTSLTFLTAPPSGSNNISARYLGVVAASGDTIVPSADNTGEVGTAALTWANGQFTNFTVDSTLIVGGVSEFSDGTAALPAITNTGDTNTGIYFPAADQVGITTGGTVRLTTTTAQFTATLPWRGQNGTAAAPAFSASADTNTGIYFPAADTIGFVEGGTEQMRITSTGLLQFNSGYGSVATAFGCRAWVSFNGTGTPAIRASGNVSSITDNGTGQYTVNFTTAMSDANYSAVASNDRAGGNSNAAYTRVYTYSTGSVQLQCVDTGAFQDPTVVSVAVFR
jgi:hypothetical protein